MAKTQFAIGSGFSAPAVVAILDRWLQSIGGIHPNTRIGKHPAAKVVHERLSKTYGAARFEIRSGSLYVLQGNYWKQLVHRDDVRNWLLGQELKVKVGKEPDPAEKGVKVDVESIPPVLATPPSPPQPDKVVDYYELDDGSFECSACGKVYKPSKRAESYVQKHIEDKH